MEIINSEKQRYLEILGVVLTATGKFIFFDLFNFRLFYIIFAILSWSIYIFWRTKQQPKILRYWGFRKDNFWSILKLTLPFLLIALMSFIIIGSLQKTINLNWHILPLLILYPIWGTLQQFLLIGLFTGNIQDSSKIRIGTIFNILLTAFLFSIVHYPDKWLMIGTFTLALYYAYIYLNNRNLYVLGILHGWLAALFYFTVVNRDPFLEVFGKI